MRRQRLNQSILLAGSALFAVALTGCTAMMHEIEDRQTPATLAEDEMIEAQEINEAQAPCLGDDGSCVLSDDFLVNQFTQTTETSDSYPMTDEDIVALSKPSGPRMVSVKDKQKLQAEQAAGKVSVSYSTLPLPEKTTITETKTDVIVKTSKPEEKKASEVKVEKDTKTEVKAENTVAVPKEEVQKSTETVKTEVKEETPVATESKKAEVKEEVKEEIAVSEPDVIASTKPAEEPSSVSGVIVAEDATVIPIKKTTTTITETTTKYKKEKKVVSNPKTLAEKVAYGESSQDWEATSGSTLRSLLMKWGDKAGWTVVWKLDRDYHLEAGGVFQGRFTDVSAALIRSFARATPAPIGTFYRGNRVLVISTQEDENER